MEHVNAILTAAARIAPCAIVAIDTQRNVLAWNPASERLFGWKTRDALGQPLRIFPPEKRAELQQLIDRTMESGRPSHLNTTCQRWDGSLVNVSLALAPTFAADGTCSGVVAAMSDLTPLQAARRCLEAHSTVTSILAQSEDLAVAGPKLLEAVCFAFAWSAAELWLVESGDDVLRRLAVWHEPAGAKSLIETAQKPIGRGQGLPGEVWAQGKPRWVPSFSDERRSSRARIAVQPALADALGIPVVSGRNVVGVVTVFGFEIDEPDAQLLSALSALGRQIGQFIHQRQIEDALHRTEENFRQSQKMEAIGLLAGGIAHDFNNVLTIILGQSEVGLELVSDQGPIRRMFEEIFQAGQRAAAMTKQLLAFSRKQVLSPVVLDLNALVRDMEKMVRRLVGETIELKAELQENLDRIYADRSQIEQVLLNLVVNARDAMPEGGTLNMRTENVEVTPAEARNHPDACPGQFVCLAVADSGCGMDKATLARVFEPFFTTKGAGKGTGMGLATTYGIVKQSKGHIRLESAPGKGTAFRIYFPRHLQALAPVRFDSAPARNLAGSETVLVVEDESVIRSLVRSILEVRGYKVLEAADGVEALRLCRDGSHAIDLLLTDVIMPQMNGRELADHFAKIYPDAKVLFMSGYTESVIGQHGALEPGVQILAKPFSSQELAVKLREVLDGSNDEAAVAQSTK